MTMTCEGTVLSEMSAASDDNGNNNIGDNDS